MSYISVWLVQAAVTFAWMRWFSNTPMSFHEFTAGAWFSAAALFTHWACHRFKPKCSGWCGKCQFMCVMATGKEKR